MRDDCPIWGTRELRDWFRTDTVQQTLEEWEGAGPQSRAEVLYLLGFSERTLPFSERQGLTVADDHPMFRGPSEASSHGDRQDPSCEFRKEAFGHTPCQLPPISGPPISPGLTVKTPSSANP